MTKEQIIKLSISFDKALERFISVNIKDITEIEEEVAQWGKPAPFVK